MEYFKLYLVVVFALYTTKFVHGVFFALFKADEYEDVLAKKIADYVLRRINEDNIRPRLRREE